MVSEQAQSVAKFLHGWHIPPWASSISYNSDKAGRVVKQHNFQHFDPKPPTYRLGRRDVCLHGETHFCKVRDEASLLLKQSGRLCCCCEHCHVVQACLSSAMCSG